MGKGKNVAKLQDTALNMFKRTIRNDEITKNEPTFFEKEVIWSKEHDEKNPLPTPKPRISFYDPNNPLNGIFSKPLAYQKELQEKMKAEGLIKRKPSTRKSSGPEETVYIDPNIKVIEAIYGAPGHLVNITALVKLGQKITNRMAGGDPIYGTKKTLKLTIEKDGKQQTKIFNEGQLLVF